MTRPRTRAVGLASFVLAGVIAASLVSGWASSLTVTSRSLTELSRPDAYAPRLAALEMRDSNANGKVDRVVATFSESLASYTAGTAPWTLANVPSAGTLASVAVTGTQATLTLNEGVGAADTTVGTFTVALASSATGVRDANGNLASFTATAPADKAGPVPTSIGTTNNGGGKNAGLLQSGDVFYAVFSESILASSVPATTTVSMSDPAGAVTIDTLTVPGLGTTNTGGTAYQATDGGTATFASSAAAVYLGTTVYVTVGSTCSGACAGLGKGSGTAVYTPASTLTDASGNAAVGSFTSAAGLVLF